MNYIPPPPTRVAFTDDEGKPGLWMSWFSSLEQLFNSSQRTGTTAQRPHPAPFIGFMYFDTTITRPIWASAITSSTTTWIKADGAAA